MEPWKNSKEASTTKTSKCHLWQKLPVQSPKVANKIPKAERLRLLKLLKIEKEARLEGFQAIAGVDEAGRGPLAGPVVAAACLIPENVTFPYVNDSKQLTPEMRQQLFEQIVRDERVCYGIGMVSHDEIDRINIYQATLVAMLQAIEGLKSLPDLLLVDGMPLPHPTIPCRKIVQGDALVHVIAAASVLAKVTRDRLMLEFHQLWPQYGFDQHKGYGTPRHLEAIEKYGPCPIHRHSYEPLKSRLAHA